MACHTTIPNGRILIARMPTSKSINSAFQPSKQSGTSFPKRRSPSHIVSSNSEQISASGDHVLPRRQTLFLALLANAFISNESQALGFKKELKKRKIPPEEYSELSNGLKYYDLTSGRGQEVKEGTQVTVHFDCIFKGIDVVSSRSARLLGGNRTIAEPFTFTAGQTVRNVGKQALGDSAGGLFSGASGPKPPPALSSAVVGMKLGGKRSVLVPANLGYGDQGEQEIGPGQSFELQIELLDIN